MNSLVSVIIPTYKRSNYILRAINSVLEQTYKHIEIIVVDDNEGDDEFSKLTKSVLKKLIDSKKVIYIKQFLLFFQIIIHLIKNKFQKSRFKNHSIGSNPSVIL